MLYIMMLTFTISSVWHSLRRIWYNVSVFNTLHWEEPCLFIRLVAEGKKNPVYKCSRIKSQIFISPTWKLKSRVIKCLVREHKSVAKLEEM